MLEANTELRYLKGVGPKKGVALAGKGLKTVEDLLYVLPFRYEDRSNFAQIAELEPGGPEVSLSATVKSARLIRTRRRGFTIFEALVGDDSGSIKAVWYNQPYLERVMLPGRVLVFYGKAVVDRYQKTILANPEYEGLDEEDAEGIHTGRVVPVYRKVGDATSRMLRGMIYRAVTELSPATLPELVPPEVAARSGLPSRLEALRRVHFPETGDTISDLVERRTPAQRALAFEEIFLLQLLLALMSHGMKQESRGIAYDLTDALRTRLGQMLPFKLTGAQKRVLKEIGEDLRSSHPMNRLVQGDVGCGKTIVALLAMLVAVENGYQAAIMAPTEILAEQHYRNIRRLLDGSPVDCPTVLLTGSLRAAERRRVLERIRAGRSRLIVGTHALFEAGVDFDRLGLVVVDEQHRFGVLQRRKLVDKGVRPDVLVMTATPIPRSLALTLYGDLDVSVIDELPPGRTPIRTLVRGERERRKVYDGLRRELSRGRQAYVVAPLVEETAKSDLKAAVELEQQLRDEVFPDLAVGLVHGRMKGNEKDEVMQAFARGEIKVLVATTVIEVGVDVSNATVMVIEHAERFGLSQLHQLRGRVGRGDARSFCVLMVGAAAAGKDALERLATMEKTNDGFEIAEKDLELRGPGAVFGTQQHGLSDLQFLAMVLKSPDLLDTARAEARRLVEASEASRKTAAAILEKLGGKWKRRLELAKMG